MTLSIAEVDFHGHRKEHLQITKHFHTFYTEQDVDHEWKEKTTILSDVIEHISINTLKQLVKLKTRLSSKCPQSA